MNLLSKKRGCVYDILLLPYDNHCYKTDTIECFEWFLFVFRDDDIGSRKIVDGVKYTRFINRQLSICGL